MAQEKPIFKPEHVDCNVTDIYLNKTGVIIKVLNLLPIHISDGKYPVVVKFSDGAIQEYTVDGFENPYSDFRRLYFGHNIKTEVTGEERPEPKLICPVCNIEHDIVENKFHDWEFTGTSPRCPLFQTIFDYKNHAEQSIKNLIKAMEGK